MMVVVVSGIVACRDPCAWKLLLSISIVYGVTMHYGHISFLLILNTERERDEESCECEKKTRRRESIPFTHFTLLLD